MSHWIDKIPSDWGIETLDNSVSKVVDNRGRTCPVTDTGIPLIATNCIKEFGLFPVFEKVRFVDDITYENWFRGHPEPNDILFVNKGTPGGVCLVPDPVPFCIAQDMVSLRADSKKFDWKYLFAALRSNFVRSQIEALNVGTSIPHLKKTDFNRIVIPKPSKEEQKVIGEIYYSINDKIELNLQMNKTLEEMAMALYKHWFVDFGPFQEGEFVDSELGKIPKGWEVKSIGDFTEILNSKRVPLSTRERSTRKGEYPYYGASGIIDSIDDYKFDGEYVIISEDGENLRSRNTPIAFRAVGKFWVNNHAHILQGLHEGINDLIICHFAQLDMSPFLTGAVQPKLNKQNLLLIKIPMPNEKDVIKEVLYEFHLISRLFISNNTETQTLTQLRDTLLPQLISGKIRVKEAAKTISAVL